MPKNLPELPLRRRPPTSGQRARPRPSALAPYGLPPAPRTARPQGSGRRHATATPFSLMTRAL
eukprot:9513660-Lingulodinium_polyedra.AAC.1